MNSKFLLLSLSTIAAALATTACIDDSVTAGKPGGYIALSNVSYGTSEYPSASAAFYANVSTAGAPVTVSQIPDLDRDSCLEVEVATPTPIATPDITYLDVGGAVMLEAGAVEIALLRDDNGSFISYGPDAAVEVDFETSYDVTLGGGGSEIEEQTWAAALRMPKKLSVDDLDTGSIVIEGGADHELTWNTVGADAVIIRILGQDQGRVTTCLAADDGSFTIPQSVVDELDLYGSITVEAITEETHTLDSRTVSVTGRSTRAGNYEVNGEPPPGSVTNCEVVWMSASSTSGNDVYAIDLETSNWTTGSKTFNTTTTLGIFLKDYQSGGSATASGRATAGTFSLEASGVEDNALVYFADDTAQSYSNTSGTVIANGGTGYFDGELSPASGNPILGSGTINVIYGPGDLTLGNAGAYAFCYDATEPALVPTTPEARVQKAVERILAGK